MSQKIVIVDSNSSHDWVEVFQRSSSFQQGNFEVFQCGWTHLSVTTYGFGDCLLSITKENETNYVKLTLRDIIVVRNEVRTIHYDKRNVIYGLKMAGINSVNSLDSILMDMDRPTTQGELLKIQHKVGKSKFPVVEQYFYSSGEDMIISPTTKPMVLKLGPWHAGIGKSFLKNHHDFEECSSLVEATNHYATCEEFIDYEYDLRIQWVDGKIRAMAKRGSGWKSNRCTGVDVEEMEVTSKVQRWCNLASKMYGGLDIFSLDVLHKTAEVGEKDVHRRSKEGDEVDYILELNGTSTGWWDKYQEESMIRIRDLCFKRLSKLQSSAS